ncbi:MAG: hypothetical protein QOF78_115 [Phycisphaerales bacterium]|jgi:hypothetical protein|nr:hypothetical protein [Phycisphaerales bacterium]
MFATPIAIEVLRSRAHRRREQKYGLASTQDIAMIGTFIGFLLMGTCIFCGIMWSRSN